MTNEQVKKAVELNNSINKIDSILYSLEHRWKTQPCTFKTHRSYTDDDEFTIHDCEINNKVFTIIYDELLLKKKSLEEELEKL